MRISDWSSDVCSADLAPRGGLLMPDLMLLEPGTAYSLWAPSYPPRAHNPVMQAEERAMLALMPDTLHGKTVLDAGCGSGRYMLHALSGGAARVVGVDLSSQMLARADTALGTRRRGVPTGLVRGSVCALPVADARADLTLCGLVAGHVEDLRRFLAALLRFTRPRGRRLRSRFHPTCHPPPWFRAFHTPRPRPP